MSKQQRDAIDAALRAAPFGLNQSTEEHRKTFEAFGRRPYPAGVAAADVTPGGVPAIELTVEGNAADPAVLRAMRACHSPPPSRPSPRGRASRTRGAACAPRTGPTRCSATTPWAGTPAGTTST
jgi:hypothetical protein